METGTMYFKIVTRKLQGSTRNFQFIILVGFTTKLSHSTCAGYETLSPNSVLSQQEVVDTIEKLRKKHSAQMVRSITNPDVEKKLQKLFGLDGDDAPAPIPGFAALGIGRYLDTDENGDRIHPVSPAPGQLYLA